jgi:hypothetical protein
MQTALEKMRQMDCAQTSSWYYQGAMHWVPDTVLNNRLCASYHTSADLKKAWDNCTHFLSNKSLSINFLVWHRLYIYHFESIVRKISGDSTFALPYWGYTDTVNVTANRTLNQLLRDPKSSLYTTSRYDSLNKGFPISGEVVPTLDLTKLFQNTDFFLFSNQIEAAPHGSMHDYIGAGNNQRYMIYNEIYQKIYNGGLMANVPSAGFDPVFWLHHSNIDRIWQQWTNSANGKDITLADLKENPVPYQFFDADGKEIVYTPEQIIKIIYNLDYNFDDTKVNQAVTTKQVASVLMSKKVISDTIVSKTINKQVPVKGLNFSVANQHKQQIALFSSKNSSGIHKTAVVKIDVEVNQEPKGIYQVYINLPKGAKPDTKGNYFAGFMTFFGASHFGSMKMGDMKKGEKAVLTFYYDLTDEFDKTGALNKENFDVSIFNQSGKGAGDITVKNIAIIVK